MANSLDGIVVSASRRTDMIAGNPDLLVERLKQVMHEQPVHSVVFWTKDPSNLFNHHELNSLVKSLDQVFVLFSITGLGGTELEPGVPGADTAMDMMPQLVTLVKSPKRIRIRFDPIVHFLMPDGREICNLDFFEILAPQAAAQGIYHIITSWVEIYTKVEKRLLKRGLSIIDIDDAQKIRENEWLESIAEKYGIQLDGCCVPGWPRSRCIDGYLLNELHPKGLKASVSKASGQRPLCGCTKSKDIGWYHKCPHGCLYCYGNPELR